MTVTDDRPVNGSGLTVAFPVAKLTPGIAGEMSPLPGAVSDTGTAAPVAAPGLRLRDVAAAILSRLRVPSGDTIITWAMAATVAVVAVDAAIVSYSHIYALATGQQGSGVETGIQPRLLPLSIDGVIVEASLVLLYAARHKLPAPRLAKFMLWLGITATVAANVVHGLPSSMLPPVMHIVISALLSAWPAGALIGSVHMAMDLVRAAHTVADESDNGSEDDTDSDTEPVIDPVRDDGPEPPKQTRQPRPPRDKVADTIRRHPDWDNDKIAAHCGVTKRTVERRRADARKATGGAP